jgi:hypothetical protein
VARASSEAVEAYERSLVPTDRPALRRVLSTPFLVIRAAGSLGFDLVALRHEFAFPIEVKASGEDTIRFSAASGRAGEQLEAHRRAVERVGLIVLYAYRRVGHRSGDPWRLFAASGAPIGRGRLELLRRKLPPVDRTREGNAVLRWDDGMPLVRFIEYVADLAGPPATGAG